MVQGSRMSDTYFVQKYEFTGRLLGRTLMGIYNIEWLSAVKQPFMLFWFAAYFFFRNMNVLALFSVEGAYVDITEIYLEQWGHNTWPCSFDMLQTFFLRNMNVSCTSLRFFQKHELLAGYKLVLGHLLSCRHTRKLLTARKSYQTYILCSSLWIYWLFNRSNALMYTNHRVAKRKIV